LVWNFVCLLAVLIVEGGSKTGDFILSVVYLLVLPIMWFLIYRILYRAARKSKPSLYIAFWVFYFLELLACAFFVTGFPTTGAAGLVYMFSLFNDNKLAEGFMLLANSVLWGLSGLFCLWIYISSRIQYKKAGGLAKAKMEAKAAALGEVKNHPDLIAKGIKYGAQEAAKHPDLIVQASKTAMQTQV